MERFITENRLIVAIKDPELRQMVGETTQLQSGHQIETTTVEDVHVAADVLGQFQARYGLEGNIVMTDHPALARLTKIRRAGLIFYPLDPRQREPKFVQPDEVMNQISTPEIIGRVARRHEPLQKFSDSFNPASPQK